MRSYAQLELADAALHAQQQPVVGPARVIDAVDVDDARLYQAAQFEQVMPIPPVAGKTGGIEAQHGPDLARTQTRHQPLESRPRCRAGSRAAEIVVDDLDVPEAVMPCEIGQLVLAALTFQVDLDLGLR